MADNAWLVGGVVLILVGFAPYIYGQFGPTMAFGLFALLGIAFFVVHFTRKSRTEAT